MSMVNVTIPKFKLVSTLISASVISMFLILHHGRTPSKRQLEFQAPSSKYNVTINIVFAGKQKNEIV